jgi:uncharacterized membrane protein
MNNGKTIGMILFIGGIILLLVYGLYLGFEEIVQAMDLITGFLIGLTLIGFIVLIVSIVIEQRNDAKQMKKEIKEEDLKP